MPLEGPMPSDARHQVLYRAVGHFITSWSHVEWLLAFVFSALAQTDLSRSRIILAGLQSFRARRDLVDRLGRAYLPDEHLDDFAKLIAKIKHLSEKRNHLAHRRAYHMSKGTFRFFSDEDETQPNTFGRYSDYQVGTIRVWRKEVDELQLQMWDWVARIARASLLETPRTILEQSDDPET